VHGREFVQHRHLFFDARGRFDEQQLAALVVDDAEARGEQRATGRARRGAARAFAAEVRQAAVLGDAEHEQFAAWRGPLLFLARAGAAGQEEDECQQQSKPCCHGAGASSRTGIDARQIQQRDGRAAADARAALLAPI